MKKSFVIPFLLLFLTMNAQDHFSGISTSGRVGLLNVGINPAELSNLTSKYEVNIFSTSINVSNDAIGIDDLSNGEQVEDVLFQGTGAVNLRIDAEMYGPGFAMRINKWAFGFSTKGYAKMTLVDIDPKIGDAIKVGNSNSLNTIATINNNYNQRLNGTTWGEMGLSASRNLFENEKNKINAGITLKFLFPGSYINFGIDKFNGTINNTAGIAYLSGANAALNISYSGNLGENFTQFNDYSQSVFGSLNGVAADLGFNYKWKDKDNYKLNVGLAVRNIGGMTFKDVNNSSTNYKLTIPDATLTQPGLNLNQFSDVNSFEEIETIFIASGYLDKTKKTSTDFKVNLPTVFSAYADVKIARDFFVALYTQQKLKSDNSNNQITTQNIISITPRLSLKNYEIYSAWSKSEFSGIVGGLGFRIFGFYIGSNSLLTVITTNSKQADGFIGFSFGLK